MKTSSRRLTAYAAVVLSVATLVPAAGRSEAVGSVSAPVPAAAAQAAVQAEKDVLVAAQRKLQGYGYVLSVTGQLDARTQLVLRHWQRANRLPVDGTLNAPTRQSLRLPAAAPGAPAAAPPSSTTPPAPPPSTVGTPGDCNSYVPLLVKYGLPVDYFKRVMRRESGCIPTSYNGRHKDRSYGLLQINTKGALWGELRWRCGLVERAQLFNPETNIMCASKLYRAYGRRPWS